MLHGKYEFDESINNDDFEDEPYDDMHGLVHDTFGMPNTIGMSKENEIPHVDISTEEPNDEAKSLITF